MATDRPRIVHERDVPGATLRTYLVGRQLVFVRGPEDKEYLSEEAARVGSAYGEGFCATELCTYYGIHRSFVRVTVLKPRGFRGAGRFLLADCGIKLVGPSRRMVGGWPRSERQWRHLHLTVTSQILVAATEPLAFDVA